jgi:hypothetical protein
VCAVFLSKILFLVFRVFKEVVYAYKWESCFLDMEFICLVIKDIFGVIYAPHKTFKKLAENPKYLAAIIIIVLFVALQSTYYYAYYSKINYEQTMPPLDQLYAFTAPSTSMLDTFVPPQVDKPWITSQGASVTINNDDYIDQNFYGNNSLQFILSKGNRLSATLEQFGYTANCAPDGFTSLSMSMKQGSPNTALPTTGTLTLYTANNTSNYFTLDITSMLTNNYNEWNNLTIPVGTSEWQRTGTPNWSEVTGIQLTLTYPESSNINILLQGIFFHGQYLTQTTALSVGAFFASAFFFTAMQALCQWLILSAIIYIIFKGIKTTNITWRQLLVPVGCTFMALTIISIIALLCSLTLPTIYFPYDFPPYGLLTYPDFIVNGASPASQITYESIVASTSTYTTINTALTALMYVLQVVFVTFAVKAVSGLSIKKDDITSNTDTTTSNNETSVAELSYAKSILIAVGAVVITTLILTLLSVMGII